ncbi:hypothetical protein NST02_14395 [Robertmurraya sp. FSL W8-0741]|uniref:hypothetical protein n=1 Tax=Robertmurraya sp. FSL W8-0741 TaxID=2954629 RepID=UPI0030F978D5
MKRLKGKRYIISILFILSVVLISCTSSPTFELYEGHPLRIAVVGEQPDVKEEQVKFTEVSFDEMTTEKLKSYDAVFIREDKLSEASESQYTDIYLNSTIPFFFIGTDNFLPFTENELEYDKTSNWTAGTSYAVGVLTSQEDDTLKKWEISLYNDEKTDEHIEEMYSRIFTTIDELNQK